MGKRILITGGCGFVGSDIGLALKAKYPGYDILALDNLKRRGSELSLPLLHEAGIRFIHGDLRIKEDLEAAGEVDLIIEAAAEPSVMAGIHSAPDYVVNTNLLGTINCLNYAAKYKSDFIFLSTSRVYPVSDIEKIAFEETESRFEISPEQYLPGLSSKGIAENFPIENSRSLYGATKLASELFIKEYGEMYGLRTVVNRCGVITGPGQMGKVDQGVVVLWMARYFWKGRLNYIGYGGEGKQVRDILHINDLFRLLDYQMHNIDKMNGQTFNVGGGREISLSLKELTAICQEISGNKIEINSIPENRAADIRIYITDNSKVTAATGWKPEISPEECLKDIYQWISSNEKQLKNILN